MLINQHDWLGGVINKGVSEEKSGRICANKTIKTYWYIKVIS